MEVEPCPVPRRQIERQCIHVRMREIFSTFTYSALNRSCNAKVKAEVTRFLTLTNQSRFDAGPHVTSRV